MKVAEFPLEKKASVPEKIIYIVGDGRCGSTILDRFLGAATGGLSLNEANEILRFGYGEKRKCSCGKAFPSCDFWQSITSQIEMTDEKRDRLIQSQKTYESTKRFFGTCRKLEQDNIESDLAEYLDFLSNVFAATSRSQNANVLVDSSKLPARAMLLSRATGAEVYVVHVVRHPCAVVNAWRKAKFDPGRGDKMERHGLLRTVAFWWARNTVGGLLRTKLPYKVVKYEDFVADPEAVASEVAAMAGTPLRDLDGGNCGYSLPEIHTISGNPDRFSSGKTLLRLDDKWKMELPAAHRRLVWLLTAPALKKFGY